MMKDKWGNLYKVMHMLLSILFSGYPNTQASV